MGQDLVPSAGANAVTIPLTTDELSGKHACQKLLFQETIFASPDKFLVAEGLWLMLIPID